MIGYVPLYGLFAGTSLLLFNALILLARYARQTKLAPPDTEYEALVDEKRLFSIKIDEKEAEMTGIKAQFTELEKQLKDAQEKLKTANTQIADMKKPKPA